ncbi:tetratricopeptide repeat protein [Aliiglaciecola litoralis]|uniref:Tetratricopeptide repeat-containing protein n=1 Tax=Aliiglaciecola litoralis TaxID=582857 RepID=A0ABN1LL80_9ALTE
MLKGLFILFFMCVFMPMSNAHYQHGLSFENVDLTLKEAQDHLVVLPEKSLTILDKNSHKITVANDEQQAQWHFIAMLAAVSVADLDRLHAALISFEPLSNTEYYQAHLDQILSALGIWFRRSGYLNDAKASYLCSLEKSSTEHSKLRALLNLGVVERNLNHFAQAKEINLIALDIATNIESETYIAVLQNNLGILAISEKRYMDASAHFTKALELNEKLNRRSGELISSMNLLLAFLYQDNSLYFERMVDRAQRKLLLSPDDTARESYLNILKAINSARTIPSSLEQSRQVILANIERVNDKGIQLLLTPLINQLGVQYNIQQQQSLDTIYQGPLLEQFSMCNWQLNSDNANMQAIIGTFAESLFQD